MAELQMKLVWGDSIKSAIWQGRSETSDREEFKFINVDFSGGVNF